MEKGSPRCESFFVCMQKMNDSFYIISLWNFIWKMKLLNLHHEKI